MKLKTQHRMAASLYDVGKKRVWIDPTKLSEVKEAITKKDIIGLIKQGVIKILPERGISSYRINKYRLQKRKGRRSGIGSRKGAFGARLNKKKTWIIKIRNQKTFLKELRDKSLISRKNYRILYKKAKGGFFRSVRHVRLFVEEHNILEHGNK